MRQSQSNTLISIDELCSELCMSRNSIYQLLSDGRLHGFKVGRVWKVPRESLDEFIHRNTYPDN